MCGHCHRLKILSLPKKMLESTNYVFEMQNISTQIHKSDFIIGDMRMGLIKELQEINQNALNSYKAQVSPYGRL